MFEFCFLIEERSQKRWIVEFFASIRWYLLIWDLLILFYIFQNYMIFFSNILVTDVLITEPLIINNLMIFWCFYNILINYNPLTSFNNFPEISEFHNHLYISCIFTTPSFRIQIGKVSMFLKPQLILCKTRVRTAEKNAALKSYESSENTSHF